MPVKGRRHLALWWLIAAALIGAGVLLLRTSTHDVERSATSAGETPMRILTPSGQPVAPAVVLVHGFSGSAAMVDPLGSALARAGHLVVMPDLPGHGTNPRPLTEGSLEPAIDAAVELAAARTGQSVAVVGHSMGAGAVTSWALDHAPAATVAISLPSAADLPADPAVPRNLLLLWGSAEQPRFVTAASEGLARGYPSGVPGTTYGSFVEGTARRAAAVAGAEHIGILYRAQTAREVQAWLADTAQGPGLPSDDRAPAGDWRLLGLLLVLVGGVVAVRPLVSGAVVPAPAGLAPGQPGPRAPRAWATAGWLVLGILGAGLGAALLPFEDALPVAVAGYLATWFAVGAVVLLLGAWRRGAWRGSVSGLLGGLVAGAILTICVALPARLTWAGFSLVGPRVAGLLVLLAVLGAWLWGEGRLLVAARGWRRAALLALSRALVVAGLLAAVGVLGAPGFLTLTVPLMVPILALLGVVAWWARDPAAGAAAQALPLAVVVATTFPIIG
ncbi:MAG TPA: alpha/beta hydrolase [Candidatus Nanopelagicales bacterium]